MGDPSAAEGAGSGAGPLGRLCLWLLRDLERFKRGSPLGRSCLKQESKTACLWKEGERP